VVVVEVEDILCSQPNPPVLRSELADFALKKLIRETKIPTHATLCIGFRERCSFGCHVFSLRERERRN